ncbi:MAG: tetratricopeptide repeat protein [Parvularculaceae bacterium]
MVNDDSLIREVDEGLAEDKLWRDIRRRGPLLLAVAGLIVIGVAVSRGLDARRDAASADAARAYREIDLAAQDGGQAAIDALAAFADEAPKGYAALARFRLAGLLATSGRREDAIAAYRRVYEADPGERLGDLARVRAGHLASADSREAVIEHVGALEEDPTPLGAFAREALALAALKAGDYQTAETMFEAASADPATPAGVRARADEFAALAAAGKAGAPISWPSADLAASPAASGAAALDAFLNDVDAAGGDLSESLRRTGPLTPDEAVAEGAATDDAVEADDAVEVDDAVAADDVGEPVDEIAAPGDESGEDSDLGASDTGQVEPQ